MRKNIIINNLGKKIILLGTLFLFVALLIYLYNNYVDINAGKESEEVLLTMQSNNIQESILENNNAKEMNTIIIDGYEYIGTIIIPDINIELPVLSNYNQSSLNIAPNRYYGSIYTNNLVICAHSYKTHFRYIKNLKSGNKIIFKDVNNNNHLYEVVKTEILDPTDVEEMLNNDYDLTLYTCTSGGKKRVTVRCNKININI